jgi:hypothetical protein
MWRVEEKEERRLIMEKRKVGKAEQYKVFERKICETKGGRGRVRGGRGNAPLS